jgi:uncharacterized protein YmfQ (DUF2313 family)
MKLCVNCGQKIDEERQEFDSTIDKGKNKIYMCEECLDYSGKTIEHYRNKNNTRRLNKIKKEL